VVCSLFTYKSVEEGRKGETHSVLAQLTGRGNPAHDVRVNGWSKSGPKPHRSVIFFHFFYESVSNTCLIERPSQLRDVVTLDGSSL
jgi:hypothetical protein